MLEAAYTHFANPLTLHFTAKYAKMLLFRQVCSNPEVLKLITDFLEIKQVLWLACVDQQCFYLVHQSDSIQLRVLKGKLKFYEEVIQHLPKESARTVCPSSHLGLKINAIRLPGENLGQWFSAASGNLCQRSYSRHRARNQIINQILYGLKPDKKNQTRSIKHLQVQSSNKQVDPPLSQPSKKEVKADSFHPVQQRRLAAKIKERNPSPDIIRKKKQEIEFYYKRVDEIIEAERKRQLAMRRQQALQQQKSRDPAEVPQKKRQEAIRRYLADSRQANSNEHLKMQVGSPMLEQPITFQPTPNPQVKRNRKCAARNPNCEHPGILYVPAVQPQVEDIVIKRVTFFDRIRSRIMGE